jgi:hypothetical protein
MNNRAAIQGYMEKEALPSLRRFEPAVASYFGGRTSKAHVDIPLSAGQMGGAVGSALGLGSGLMGNYLFSKILGYDGTLLSYIAAGGTGALAGGALGYGLADKAKYYADNPEEFNKLLEKIESSPKLQKWHEWQKQSPLMKPVRQAVGRIATNVKEPRGYTVDSARDLVKREGPVGLVQGAIADRPMYKTDSNRSESDAFELKARDALWRQYFDLPSREGQPGFQDFFVQDPNDPKTVRFNPRTAEGERLQQMAESSFQQNLKPDRRSSKASFMGGVAIKDTPQGYAVSDPWDMHTSRHGNPDAYTSEAGLKGRSGMNLSEKKRSELKTRDYRNHLLRNIFDRLISNPVTVEHTFAKP